MEEIIARGESVIVDNRIVDNVNDLPNEAELAKGNKEAEKAAKASIKAQMEALEAQLKSLDDPKPKEPVVDEGADEDFAETQVKEEEARKADEKARANAAVEAEKERKADEEKKAAAVKKEADKKA